MKSKFFVLLIMFTANVFAQTKNYIDQPYLETKAKVDTLVAPDLIYLSIAIKEKDTKGKISVEDLENKMGKTLKSLKIDLKKQLTLSDLGSNFNKYFLKSKDIEKNKKYILLVYDAKTAGEVIYNLEQIGISNVTLKRTEYSKMDELLLQLKSRAILKAKLQANYLVAPLHQKIGAAIYISDSYNSQNYRYDDIVQEEVVVVGYGSNFKKEYKSIDIEFKKIKVESQINVKFILAQ